MNTEDRVKKIVAFALVVLAAAALPAMAEMTAEEIIAKHLEATGGTANFAKIKSIEMRGSMFAQGMPLEMKMVIVPPAKGYMEIGMNNTPMMRGGSNGVDAWQSGPMGTVALEGDAKASALKQTDIFSLVDYAKKGTKVKLLGKDMVKGAEAYRVEVIDKDNDTTEMFIDATTFYLVREKSSGGSQSYSNYKKVADLIVVPYKRQAQAPEGSVMITIDTVIVNPQTPDSLFIMPANAIPMSKMPKPGGAPGGGGGQ